MQLDLKRLFTSFYIIAIVFIATGNFEIHSARAAGLWYVKNGGSDSNDCQTPATACASINAALNKPGFVAGDTIRVAVGTYTGTGSEVVLINKDATLSGGWDATFTTQSGMATIDGEGMRRGITVAGGFNAVIERFILQSGVATDQGGGFFNNGGIVTLSKSQISGNIVNGVHGSGNGGGIYNSGTLTITHTTISRNTAGNPSCCSNGRGGGIKNTGVLTINNSTVNQNQAWGPETVTGDGIDNAGTMVLTNSTVSGNYGTGVWTESGVSAFYNDTIVNNGYYGLGNTGTSHITLHNTLFANNGFNDCVIWSWLVTMTNLGYNLFGGSGGCAPVSSDLINVDPQIGPLQDNGGFTFTHTLLPSSPAINGGNLAGCTNHTGLLLTDQRGLPRFGRCDIGAIETQPLTYSTKTVNLSTIAPGDPLTYTISLTNGGLSTITNVLVTDTLPTSATYIPNSPTAPNGSYGYSNGTITWSGDVNAGTSTNIIFGATVKQSVAVDSRIENSAIISGNGETFTRTTISNVASPFATSSKNANTLSAARDESITYTIVVTNSSVAAVTNALVTDRLPANLGYKSGSLIASTGSAGYSNGTITWTGTIGAREKVTITFDAKINQAPSTGRAIVNSAIINGRGVDITRTATVDFQFPQVFFPMLARNCKDGIYGRVTDGGNPAPGVPLELRYFNGFDWLTEASTSTTTDGSFVFTGIPDLMPGRMFYVRYINSATPTRLSYWATRILTSFTSSDCIGGFIGNFDIANIDLFAPPPGTLIALPFLFQWKARSATPTDSYEFNLLDYTDGNPWWWTAPLGYVGGYTLNSLPSGFSAGTPYGWSVGVYSPDGGYGQAYYLYVVGFNNTGNAPRPSAPARARPMLEDLPRPKILNTR
ncbi:MAG: DUF11 domain-containing protein [Chloroflexi bacterium]|nr:DUF11 domain-containing protein [Chloroflexota bacterium]